MNREQANKVVSLCKEIDKLNKEREDLDSTSRIAYGEGLTTREKIELLFRCIERHPELSDLIISSFCGALHILIETKKEEIEKAKKELESL